MPKARKKVKRKRRESTSSNSTSSSNSTHSSNSASTSSTSSSGSDKNRRMKSEIKRLKKKLNEKNSHYQGKIDSVPSFSGQANDLNMQQWLHTINSTGDIFGWDEKARIFCMVNKLKGNAKSWYNNQVDLKLSWKEWKKKLLAAFPSLTGIYFKLKDFVNNERPRNQNPVDFYYKKLSLGQSCKLAEDVIVEVIINTLNDPFLKSGAKAASCHSTGDLLKFLISNSGHYDQDIVVRKNNVKHSGRRFHGEPSTSKIIKCYVCNREGHKKINCPNLTTSKFCNFCKFKGHVEDECFKKNKNKKANPKINKISFSEGDETNQKFHKIVLINDKQFGAYIDFGSACNTIQQKIVEELLLEVKPNSDHVVIQGYGGANVHPLGVINTKIVLDDISMHTDFFVVPDNMQKTELLIGRPVTEKDSILVYKDSNVLRFIETDSFKNFPSDLFDFGEKKIKLFASEDIIVKPGLNLVDVFVNSGDDLLNGYFVVNFSEQNHGALPVLVPRNNLKVRNNLGVLKILNLSSCCVEIKKDFCLARGIEKDCRECYQVGEATNESDREKLRKILEKYSSCFSENNGLLSNIDLKMRIELTSNTPITHKPYRLSLFERERVNEIVSEMLEKGIVEPTTSSYASPVILLKKNNGDYRMVVDYRRLNQIMVKDKYPLPLIEDHLERLSGSKIFTVLDLKSGYHQIEVEQESRKFTAFVTPDGHWQYTRVPFGLSNAPAIFQRAINSVLGNLRHKYILVYIDDILILAKTTEEAIERLEEVLKLFDSAGLTLNLQKCGFLKDSVEYLGTEISHGVLKPSSSKLEAIKSFPVPRSVHQVRQFIGLASYFRKYIHQFALKAKPLTSLMKKSASWQWGTEQQDSFEKLRDELASGPTLAIFDPEAETQLHTDASQIGVAGVLLQKQSTGDWKPIAYMSRQTSDPETRYHSFELETLAVFEAVKKFRNFLFGRKFVIVTDCNAVRLTWSKRDVTPRVGRWWMALQEYDFTIEHRPGNKMIHVDALSRNPVEINSVKYSDWVCGLQALDEDTQLIKTQIDQGTAETCYTIVEDKVCRIIDGENKILIPKCSRWKIVQMYHDENGHPGWERTLDAIRKTYWFKDMKNFVKKFVQSCINCLKAKKSTGRKYTKLHPIEKVEEPFHTLHLDHVGPFCKTQEGNTQILVIVDAFTKFVWMEALPDTSSENTCKVLEGLIKLVHPPKRVITDRGKSFDCKRFSDFCKQFDIKHVKNAIASPRSNGQVERSNRTILEALTACIESDHHSWDKHINKVQRGINATKNATTGFAPSELLYGVRPKVENEIRLWKEVKTGDRLKNLEEVRKIAKLKCDKTSVKMKQSFDKNKKDAKEFKEGNIVLVERSMLVKGLKSGKLVPKYIGPVKIVEKLGNDRYKVVSFSKDRRRFRGVVASDRLRLFKPQQID